MLFLENKNQRVFIYSLIFLTMVQISNNWAILCISIYIYYTIFTLYIYTHIYIQYLYYTIICYILHKIHNHSLYSITVKVADVIFFALYFLLHRGDNKSYYKLGRQPVQSLPKTTSSWTRNYFRFSVALPVFDNEWPSNSNICYFANVWFGQLPTSVSF